MCGIFAIASQIPITAILLQGLKRLEYRGYDSSGIAVLTPQGELTCIKSKGRVHQLESLISVPEFQQQVGIAHTRWATHGEPSDSNAHPHISEEQIAIVHNGVIENYSDLKILLTQKGYVFKSHTDSEVVAHLIHMYRKQGADTKQAIMQTVEQLKGSFSLAILDSSQPEAVFGYSMHSPIVLGKTSHGYAFSSDALALSGICEEVLPLSQNQLAVITKNSLEHYQCNKLAMHRISIPFKKNNLNPESLALGNFTTYTEKEICEQPQCVSECLEGRLLSDGIASNFAGIGSDAMFQQVRAIQIVACGTSYHAGLVASHWFESHCALPTNVDIASEFIYRERPVPDNCLLIAISQSGETSDTINALRSNKHKFFSTVSITNRMESTLSAETDFTLCTHAGPEIGVASTKAFTTQLTILLLISLRIRQLNSSEDQLFHNIFSALTLLPNALYETINVTTTHSAVMQQFFQDKRSALFLGRGIHYPIALEGALKLKELSYIHAEAYPAGELKHGPLAMIDASTPVVAVAPSDSLLEKIITNIHEVHARGGKLLVFSDHLVSKQQFHEDIITIPFPIYNVYTSPILFTIPLQWLAFQVALARGTDIDKPRNLAKSVTVE
ncbi:MAG: glutamine--fructose-6-phosphate transaminase (isomerizing) [Methylacidiphilales bacterium]|nr:glutamine--fructose-6-phosphate transaminase (isomerizing) [Candidatus Methylacidiphilales bacterium]